MTRRRPLMILLALLGASTTLGLIAQDSAPESRPASTSTADATIHDLAWIAGKWTTTQGGAALEEFWTEPLVNSMTGIFRWQRGEAIWLYEFMLFEQTEAGIHFHLRHFLAGSIGWETKDEPKTYKLIEIAPGRAVFENPEKDDTFYHSEAA